MINKTERTKHGYDRVMAVYEYYDGPRKGIANFQAVPHYFECVFDEQSGEYSEWYLLTRLNPKALKAGLENWKIFLRWRKAFDSGKVGRETHPALPKDKEKYDKTKRALDDELASHSEKRSRAKGDFDVLDKPRVPRDLLSRWQVKWTEM
jgi:hypothetical protein